MTQRTAYLFGRAIVVGVAVLVAWAVLARASMHVEEYEVTLAGCAILALLSLAVPVAGLPRFGRVPPLLFALGAAISLQLVPLPLGVLTAVSPAADRFLREFEVGYRIVGPDWHALSIRPAETLVALCLYAGYGLLLWGTLRVLSLVGSRLLVRALIVVGAIVAVVGIIQDATFDGRLLWMYPFPYEHRPFGPFVNKNNFAGWMLLMLGLTLGYSLGLLSRYSRALGSDTRSRLLWLASRRGSEVVLALGAAFAMGLSLVMTMSRSGMAGLVVIVLVLSATVLRKQNTGRFSIGALLVIVALPVGLASWVGMETLSTRFADATGATLAGRIGAWRDTLDIIKDFPLSGTGLGTYATSMLRYQQHDAINYWSMAHNDFLQLIAEGGLLVVIPSLLFAVAAVRAVRHERRHDAIEGLTYWIRVGAIGGMIGIAAQEFVEFSLTIPGNVVLFTVLLAIGLHRPLFGSSGTRARITRRSGTIIPFV